MQIIVRPGSKPRVKLTESDRHKMTFVSVLSRSLAGFDKRANDAADFLDDVLNIYSVEQSESPAVDHGEPDDDTAFGDPVTDDQACDNSSVT